LSLPYQSQPPTEQPTLAAALAQAALASGSASTTPPTGQPPNQWSLGDLLARASKDEPVAVPVPVQVASAAQASSTPGINIDQIAAALDPQTAGAIWARFRSGQRGILVRSIYSAEGRQIFDDVQRRYQTDLGFRGMIDRFTSDFEREMREVEARDTTGQTLQTQLVSPAGRVYLFLAHASARLH
jgi:hypothetical protein